MRVAVFSDTHGNSIALDAVLADIERAGGVDAHWFVGDAALIGFDPVGTVQRLVALPNLVAVHGNGDRRVATDPGIVREITERFVADASPGEAAIWRSVLADSEWTRDGLQAAELFGWITGLPLEARVTLPDGTRVLLVHAAPGTDEGNGINASQSEDDLRAMLAGVEAGLVFVGHTHQPLDRTVDGVRVMEPRERQQSAACRQAGDVDPAGSERIRLHDRAAVRGVRPGGGTGSPGAGARPGMGVRAGIFPGGSMTITNLELFEIQIEAAFTHDAAGRIIADNEPDGEPAPRFLFCRLREGNRWRVGHDVPEATASRLSELAASEAVSDDLRALPDNLDAMLETLNRDAEASLKPGGPAYYFPAEIPAPTGVTRITYANIELVRQMIPGFEQGEPSWAMVVDDKTVSVCHSVPDHRAGGRGRRGDPGGVSGTWIRAGGRRGLGACRSRDGPDPVLQHVVGQPCLASGGAQARADPVCGGSQRGVNAGLASEIGAFLIIAKRKSAFRRLASYCGSLGREHD